MFLKKTVESGYTVVVCFIGISGPRIAEQRVAMRVSQGGHDVPSAKDFSGEGGIRTLGRRNTATPR